MKEDNIQEEVFELNCLVSHYVDQTLSDEQWQYLAECSEDVDFQREWKDQLDLHMALMVSLSNENDCSYLSSLGHRQKLVWLWSTIATSAALIAIGFTMVGLVTFLTHKSSEQVDVVRVNDLLPDKPMAIVIDSSELQPFGKIAFLGQEEFFQESGWKTIQTLNGVSVTFEAPFRAQLVNQGSLKLLSGSARVFVPERESSFKIEAGLLQINAKKSEFAVAYNRDGSQRCRVMSGQADVSYVGVKTNDEVNTTLTSSLSLRVDQHSTGFLSISEMNSDYPELKFPDRELLALSKGYGDSVAQLGPIGHWRFDAIVDGTVRNSSGVADALQAIGSVNCMEEEGENKSGNLNCYSKKELFSLNGANQHIETDFSVGMFFQVDWLANFNLVSASRYDDKEKGYSFLLQTYSDFDVLGPGTGIRSVYRDKPSWSGGMDIFGHRLISPYRWYHLVAVRQKNELTLFLDGVGIGGGPIEDSPFDFKQLYFGRISPNPEMTRNKALGIMGRIDELVLFNRALSESEVVTLSNGRIK